MACGGDVQTGVGGVDSKPFKAKKKLVLRYLQIVKLLLV